MKQLLPLVWPRTVDIFSFYTLLRVVLFYFFILPVRLFTLFFFHYTGVARENNDGRTNYWLLMSRGNWHARTHTRTYTRVSLYTRAHAYISEEHLFSLASTSWRVPSGVGAKQFPERRRIRLYYFPTQSPPPPPPDASADAAASSSSSSTRRYI